MSRPSIFDPVIAVQAKGATGGQVVRQAAPEVADEAGMMRTSLYLPRAVHDKPRRPRFRCPAAPEAPANRIRESRSNKMSQESLTDATPELRPIASSERIQALDVVR